MKKWQIITENIKKGKTEDDIFYALQKENIKINRKKLQKNIRQVRRIKELVKQGKSGNEIQEILQDEKIGLRRQTLQGIIRNLKGVGKRERKRKKFICLKYVEIKHWDDDRYIEYDLEKLEKPVSTIYKMIEDYVFRIHSLYDDVIVDFYISDKKEDEKYRLCFRRLKSLYHTIFKHCKRLRLDNINDITDDLAFEFSLDEISYRKKCFKTLEKIKEILNKKEILEKEEAVA